MAFKARGHPDPAEYVKNAISRAPYSNQAQVRVLAPVAEVSARIDTRWVTLTPVDDGTTLLEASDESLQHLAVYCVMTGLECELLQPPALVAVASELADRLRRSAARGAQPT
ncbi:MAG: YafY family transcriptional regulator [Nocardioides sp.]|nr:hypothetical protein [Nocardioides sp.]MCW2832743.1 YafY family transcriptional regulator [Nocardioides sp.]